MFAFEKFLLYLNIQCEVKQKNTSPHCCNFLKPPWYNSGKNSEKASAWANVKFFEIAQVKGEDLKSGPCFALFLSGTSP